MSLYKAGGGLRGGATWTGARIPGLASLVVAWDIWPTNAPCGVSTLYRDAQPASRNPSKFAASQARSGQQRTSALSRAPLVRSTGPRAWKAGFEREPVVCQIRTTRSRRLSHESRWSQYRQPLWIRSNPAISECEPGRRPLRAPWKKPDRGCAAATLQFRTLDAAR
jgi:hypothetical protein